MMGQTFEWLFLSFALGNPGRGSAAGPTVEGYIHGSLS